MDEAHRLGPSSRRRREYDERTAGSSRVFTSGAGRWCCGVAQAIRCAVDLQGRFDEEAELDHEIPLRVGIGIDSGESVALEDGSFRGAALNVAARLCARAHAGDVIVTEATYRLAGRLEGLTFSDRGRVHLKNISDPIHILKVYSEQDAPTPNRLGTIFARPGGQLGWKLAAGVMGLAALTAAGVVYLTAGDGGEGGNSFRVPPAAASGGTETLAADAGLDAIVPAALWEDCRVQSIAGADRGADGRVPAVGRDARSVGDLHVPGRGRRSRPPMSPSYAGARTSRAARARATRSRGAASAPGCTAPTSPEGGSSATSTGTTR